MMVALRDPGHRQRARGIVSEVVEAQVRELEVVHQSREGLR